MVKHPSSPLEFVGGFPQPVHFHVHRFLQHVFLEQQALHSVLCLRKHPALGREGVRQLGVHGELRLHPIEGIAPSFDGAHEELFKGHEGMPVFLQPREFGVEIEIDERMQLIEPQLELGDLLHEMGTFEFVWGEKTTTLDRFVVLDGAHPLAHVVNGEIVGVKPQRRGVEVFAHGEMESVGAREKAVRIGGHHGAFPIREPRGRVLLSFQHLVAFVDVDDVFAMPFGLLGHIEQPLIGGFQPSLQLYLYLCGRMGIEGLGIA